MKRLTIACFIGMLLIAMLGSCSKQGSSSNEVTSVTTAASHTASTTEAEVSTVELTNIEDLTLCDQIVSVQDISEKDARWYVAYQIIFLSDGLQIQADIIAPADYASKSYPMMFYYPEVKTVTKSLASQYADNGITVVRLYERGMENSQGARNYGGTDHVDAITLAKILAQIPCFTDSKKIVAGSSIGSILALRAVAESDLFDGCAVVNVISDLSADIDAMGQKRKDLYTAAIGKTIEEAPEEYTKRSAVYFSDQLDRPVFILAYRNHPYASESQAIALQDALQAAKNPCTLVYLDELPSDFVSTEAQKKLLSWIYRLEETESTNTESSQKNAEISFHFKDNSTEETQQAVIAETRQTMRQVEQMLGVTISETITCTFDPNYVTVNGEARSQANYSDRTIHCLAYTDFVHEYIHMLLNLSESRRYEPNDILDEGTACYFSLLWGELYGSQCRYLYTGDINRTSSNSDDMLFCNLLKKENLDLTQRNYTAAHVSVVTKTVGPENYRNLGEEYVNYSIGQILVEYLITQCGGIDVFLPVFFEAEKAASVYGADIEILTQQALTWNINRFE